MQGHIANGLAHTFEKKALRRIATTVPIRNCNQFFCLRSSKETADFWINGAKGWLHPSEKEV
jgi:hypothetical protein